MKHQNLVTTPDVSKRMAHVCLKGGPSEVTLAKALSIMLTIMEKI